MKIKGRIVVITGGSKGLGRALAETFKHEHATVIICSRSAHNVAITSKETGTIPFVADVKSEKQLGRLAKFVIKKFGRIDFWVNNAGITQPHAPITKINLNKGKKIFEINVFGTINGSRAALNWMKKNSCIINIISSNSFRGRILSSIYTASKWAVRGFTECLKLAAKQKNITVIGVHPGGMKTELFGKHQPDDFEDFMDPCYVAKKIVDNIKQTHPLTELIIKD